MNCARVSTSGSTTCRTNLRLSKSSAKAKRMLRPEAQVKSQKSKVKREDKPPLSHFSVSKGRRGRPTISIIGAGRLGTALARALASCGYPIETVVARRTSQAKRAAQLISAQTRALTIKQLDQLPQSDV